MVFTSFNATLKVAVVTCAAVAVSGFTPAYANSSSNADIAAPLRAAQASKPAATASGDEQFRKLFSSWESLEKSNVPALAAVGEAAEAGRVGLTATARVRTVTALMPSRTAIPSRTPLDGVRLTSSFGMRTHPVLGGARAHNGIDLAAPVGTPVYATADGLVGKAEWFGGYGLYVGLRHGGNIETRYAHMSRLNVAAGQRVRKGDIVGFVGSTGRSTGPHLHYEVRIGGQAVNPIPYMQSSDSGSARLAAVRK